VERGHRNEGEVKQSSILPRTEMEPPNRFSDLHYCFDPWNGSQGASRLTYGLGLTGAAASLSHFLKGRPRRLSAIRPMRPPIYETLLMALSEHPSRSEHARRKLPRKADCFSCHHAVFRSLARFILQGSPSDNLSI
jgi:hypothetical protein